MAATVRAKIPDAIKKINITVRNELRCAAVSVDLKIPLRWAVRIWEPLVLPAKTVRPLELSISVLPIVLNFAGRRKLKLETFRLFVTWDGDRSTH